MMSIAPGFGSHEQLRNELELLRAENQQLRDRLAECHKDAERYRWLRDLPDGSPHEQIGNLPGDWWDQAIDAAIAAQNEKA